MGNFTPPRRPEKAGRAGGAELAAHTGNVPQIPRGQVRASGPRSDPHRQVRVRVEAIAGQKYTQIYSKQ